MFARLHQTSPSPDLLVIGGGIVGAATAYFAARRGMRCMVLEARPQVASLTTAVAAGGYRMQLEHRDELDLVQRSVTLFEDEFAGSLRPQGYLWMTTDPGVAERQRELVARQREWGVDGVELLPGDEVRERFPWVSPDVIQARFRARDGLIDPSAVARGLLERSGAEVVTGCRATGFRIQSDRLQAVETAAGTIACGRAVIACGPLSGTVAALAGVELPVAALRRQRVRLWDVPEVPAGAPMAIDEDTAVHWRPTADGAFALFPDPAEVAGEPADVVPGDQGFGERLLDPASPTALARVAPFWADVYRAGRARWVVEAGQYTMTPDQRPLIGETAVGGLWVNTGYSGHGVMAGPGGSDVIAGLIAGELQDAARFALGRTFVHSSQAW